MLLLLQFALKSNVFLVQRFYFVLPEVNKSHYSKKDWKAKKKKFVCSVLIVSFILLVFSLHAETEKRQY